MRTPALYLAEELMPYIRAKIAEILYRGDFTQAEIADYLGVTQAMVSKYLAGNYKRPEDELAKKLDEIAEEVGKFILYGGSKEGAIVLLSKRLIWLFQSGFLCRSYSRYAGISEEACHTIYSGHEGRMDIIEKLTVALENLAGMGKFPELIPEVRSNFAYALPSPNGKEDVAAVPGRITIAKGRVHYLPPEFGASSFTAGILVELSKSRPEIRSVLNIRYGRDIEAALEGVGFKVGRVKTGGLSEEEAVKAIANVFTRGSYDAVVDEGGFGVEPLVYIFGRDPLEVLDKLKKLVENL